MRHGLDWEEISRGELAEHLQSARLIRSQAVGETCLYHCQHADGDSIAIALPGGSGLIIGLVTSVPSTLERRKPSPGEAENSGASDP